MPSDFLQLLSHLAIGLALVAGLLGLVRYRQLAAGQRALAMLAIFDALMELTVSFVWRVLHLPNLFLAPFVLAGELTLTALVYRQALQSVGFSRLLPWLLGLFLTYALGHSLLQLSAIRHLVPLEITTHLLLLGLAGLYFQKLLNELHIERLRSDPFFWLSVALTIYGLGNLLISLFSNYLLTHSSLQLQRIMFSGVHNVFNVQLYLAYCLALCLRPPQAQPPGA